MEILKGKDKEEFFLKEAYLQSEKSKDLSTHVGSVLVRGDISLCAGFNGLPRGVTDYKVRHTERPEKYFYTEHAERNNIYNAARNGIKTEGCSLYVLGYPCADCARAVIQSGIKKIFLHKQWNDSFISKQKKWEESSRYTKEMLEESGVTVKELDYKLGMTVLIAEKLYVI